MAKLAQIDFLTAPIETPQRYRLFAGGIILRRGNTPLLSRFLDIP